jgi:predicted RNase H-like HicB family nuclease
MEFNIVFDREKDGRWIAEIENLPGVLAFGATRTEAQSKVEALAQRVVVDQIEAHLLIPDQVHFAAA